MERLLAARPAARQLLDDLRALSATLQSLPQEKLGEDLSQRVLRAAERRMLTEGKPDEAEISPFAPVPLVRSVFRRFVNRRTLAWLGLTAAIAVAIWINEQRAAGWQPARRRGGARPTARWPGRWRTRRPAPRSRAAEGPPRRRAFKLPTRAALLNPLKIPEQDRSGGEKAVAPATAAAMPGGAALGRRCGRAAPAESNAPGASRPAAEWAGRRRRWSRPGGQGR